MMNFKKKSPPKYQRGEFMHSKITAYKIKSFTKHLTLGLFGNC